MRTGKPVLSNSLMITDLTPFERRLAHRLPCTGAAFVGWYSRHWRTVDVRSASVFHAILITGFVVGLSLIPGHRAVAEHGALPPSMAMLSVVSALVSLVGAAQGRWVIARCRRQLATHWLASTLTSSHIVNEIAIAAVLHGLGTLSICSVAYALLPPSQMLPASGVLAASVAYLVGYAGACVCQFRARAQSLAQSVIPQQRARGSRLPAFACLQAKHPAALLVTMAVTAALSILLCGVALAGRTTEPLVMSAVIVVVGWGCSTAQISPGAAAAHALLAWTGIEPRQLIAKLMLFPFLISLILAASATVTSVFLAPLTGLSIAFAGLALSTLVSLIRLVADLHAVCDLPPARFTVIQTMTLGLLVSFGPAGLLLYPLYAFWLIRKAQRLWKRSV